MLQFKSSVTSFIETLNKTAGAADQPPKVGEAACLAPTPVDSLIESEKMKRNVFIFYLTWIIHAR